MGVVLLSLAAVTGLVGLAVARPAMERARDMERLGCLRESLRGGKITTDLAEDGAVLARKFGQTELEEEFKKTIADKKRRK